MDKVSCEGPQGKTTLKETLPTDPAAYFRTDDMTPKVISLLKVCILSSNHFFRLTLRQ